MAEDKSAEPIVASAPPTESVTTIPCAICRRQFSRYTCPRCNIPYCSLVCFRSEKHADCSESFYRKAIEEDVKSAPSSSAEERRRMMELLKRFEEDTLEESPLLGDSDDDGDDTDDLQSRLQNIDIDSVSYEELWAVLTPAEREKFLSALNDPNSELAQQLLASEELEREQVDPWWDAPSDDVESEISTTPSIQGGTKRRHGSKPTIMSIPEPLVKQSSQNAISGPLLLYNICAVFITYAYIVRYFAVSPLSAIPPNDPDRVEIRRSISQLVPFLMDRRSTFLHSSLSGVVTDLWSRFPPGHMDSRFFSLLLKDIAFLIRPATVTVIPSQKTVSTPADLKAHPSSNALRVLSDLVEFFSESKSDDHGKVQSDSHPSTSSKPKPNHVVHKLTFYAAYILGTPAPMLRVLADEAIMRAKMLENEAKQQGALSGGQAQSVRRMGPGKDSAGAKIEELT
ncbi:hypothetical protein PYCCODRAFT_1475794 [Trametes coccinea BRFM310]|uniref:HIT-type domain-containing protein n=1 Tax=Trametes coccinea (strain BRFM310) TaxID=1353009 RepID=A0A1Y2IWX2_TRAC3|nr:hypothetical protein PYCCODRAFT_1475794 [Trametes coccinea BRFM310]